MNRILAAALMSVVLVASPPALANDDLSARAEQQMAEARARLNLSDEQAQQMAPVIENSISEQRAVLARYGINLDDPQQGKANLKLRQARSMRGEMTTVREGTVKALSAILDEAQLSEFKKMQAERSEQVRERIRGRR